MAVSLSGNGLFCVRCSTLPMKITIYLVATAAGGLVVDRPEKPLTMGRKSF